MVKKIYKTNIKAVDDIKVANGYEFAEKLLKVDQHKKLSKITKTQDPSSYDAQQLALARDTYDKLKNSGFYNSKNILAKDYIQRRLNIKNSDFSQLTNYLNMEIKSEKGKKLIEEYANKGYDAIPDVEDLSYPAYTSPMIVLNPDKFKVVKARRVIA